MQIHDSPLKVASELKWNIAMTPLEIAIQFQEEAEQYTQTKLNWSKILARLYSAATMISQEKPKQVSWESRGGWRGLEEWRWG